MSAEELAMLETVNKNLTMSEKGQALAREVALGPGMEPTKGWKTTLEGIAAENNTQP